MLTLAECMKCYRFVDFFEFKRDSHGLVEKQARCGSYEVKIFPYSFYECQYCGMTDLSYSAIEKHEATCYLENFELPLWNRLSAKGKRARGRTLLRKQVLVYRLHRVHDLSIDLIARTLELDQTTVKNYVGAVFKMLCTKDDECVFKDVLKVKTRSKTKQQKLFPD